MTKTDYVTTNTIVADGYLTQQGARWSIGDRKEGEKVTLFYSDTALCGMTDNGQPGWDDRYSDVREENIERSLRTARIVSPGPSHTIDRSTIRVIKTTKRIVTTEQEFDITDLYE